MMRLSPQKRNGIARRRRQNPAIVGTPLSGLPRRLATLLLITGAAAATATPLDDRIKAFETADEQTESAAAGILEAGLREQRSALAYAAVQGWLGANPTDSERLLFAAARGAERAGEWSEAASLYRKLLLRKQLDATTAAEAVPAAYRLLINDLRDTNAAYLFMREQGGRLRGYGRARQFDRWFLDQARTRGDLPAQADRLAAIYAGDKRDAELHRDSFDALMREIETFRHGGRALDGAMQRLAAAPGVPKSFEARWKWIQAIVRYMPEASRNLRKPVPAELMEEPLTAAKALIDLSPYEGSKLVARGWARLSHGDTPTFMRFVTSQLQLKAPLFLEALSRLPDDQALSLLRYRFQGPRWRWLGLDVYLRPGDLRALATRFPAAFNTLAAPDMALWEKDIPLDQAKTIAPSLARNPHRDAALIRAYADAGEMKVAPLLAALMRTERWRFADAKSAVEAVWRSGCDREGADHSKLVKQYANPGERAEQLARQVGKKATKQDRTQAMQALQSDLTATSPTIPGALELWSQLFANAPDADKVTMLTTLVDDLSGEREHLFRRATGSCRFGKAGKLFWQANVYRNHFRYHQAETRRHAGEFIDRLTRMVQRQIREGRLNETVFGLWLHSVDNRKDDVKALMAKVAASDAYARISPTYHHAAMDQYHFGDLARPGGQKHSGPHALSRELLALPEKASAEQVETAFRTVMDRLVRAPHSGTVLGLHKVAALQQLNRQTETLAWSLFRENAPIGDYPDRQGYEQLARTCAARAAGKSAEVPLEPYLPGLWRAAVRDTDQRRNYPTVEALTSHAEAALEAGNPSLAVSIARMGLSRGMPGLGDDDRGGARARRGRLRRALAKGGLAIGAFEIPVDETDPTYPIYKSNAEFVQGNLESAWNLYIANADQLRPKPEQPETPSMIRKLPVPYAFWLLRRTVAEGRLEEAAVLVRELTIWSRQAEGTFSLEQDAELKVAYADLAFAKGALPTARAWYRKVVDAREYRGSAMQVRAVLGSVKVDRVSKNFTAALEDLDKLMRIPDEQVRTQVHYARAEVLMDQENYRDALTEADAALRADPSHADALILRGKIQYRMRKLVEASEIELGVSREDTVMVPGETLKINLLDPTLSVSGVTAEIEVEVVAKSGDRERVMLHQLGDSKDKFRAEVPTALGAPNPGDKVLQVLGVDEIRYGYSERFRAKMKELPPDPDVVIGIAADAHLSLSAGAFPPRQGERKLDLAELGVSTAQRKLGTRAVRPGNPIYLRVIDADQSKTADIDELVVSLATSSGDQIRRLPLTETGPYTGIFEATVPTSGGQAMAFSSESGPGRDPNMAISPGDYPGWQGEVGQPDKLRTFGVDLNDSVMLGKMTVTWQGKGGGLTRFVLQTSMNGRDWTTRARRPAEETAAWDGRPWVASIPTYRGGISVSEPKGHDLPPDWLEKMELLSARASCGYRSALLPDPTSGKWPIVNCGNPDYSGLAWVRLMFHQKQRAIRRFRVSGWPASQTIFLIDGKPADHDADDPMLIERQLEPGLHEIQLWRHAPSKLLTKGNPGLLCDVPGNDALAPCPQQMFDPAGFPEGIREQLPKPATLKPIEGGIEIAFGPRTQARLIRLAILGFAGVAPTVKAVTLTDAVGATHLPVQQDFMALRRNRQLEVLPGDKITARYEDETPATPRRTRHAQNLTVAFHTAALDASFLNYVAGPDGGKVLEPETIRRFAFDSPIAIIVDDADMDGSAERDIVEVTARTSDGSSTTLKAVETTAHSGRFVGRIFPIEGKPERDSQIQIPEGGTLTLIYRDMENLDPGIPADREATIQHASYTTPRLGVYTIEGKPLPAPPPPKDAGNQPTKKSRAGRSGPEQVAVRNALHYTFVPEEKRTAAAEAVIGASLCFDVVAPHFAFAGSSEITAYAQVRPATPAAAAKPFDITLPGTLKLTGRPARAKATAPAGYTIARGPVPPTNAPPLEEGRFGFSVPLILGHRPRRSFATRDADSLPSAALPEGLAVQAGDVVAVGYAYKDAQENVQWKTATFTVGSHAFLDVMNGGYTEPLGSAFVGEKIFVRVIDRGLDRSPNLDTAAVTLKAATGASATLQLRETDPHSGIFKGLFPLSYAPEKLPDELPPVELNGLPVRYGDTVTITYQDHSRTVTVNQGADGAIQPFSKRFAGDAMAVQTSFTLAECFFELAKKHRKMDQESLARREIAHARKLLNEAIATRGDLELRAHAEYLLGNLSQEFADLAKNEASRLPNYQQALARFIKIPVDYPETEFAPKAQFKIGLVYEKMREMEIAVEEYVKLAYKYPECEYIPEVMSRLGGYFQAKGQEFKQQADALRQEKDLKSKAEVLRLDELSYPEFLKAARIFNRLQERFPDHKLAGLAGVRSGQNYMRAHQYAKAADILKRVYDNETFDGSSVRARAMFWCGWSYEMVAAAANPGDWKGRGNARQEAYQLYRRITFDYPDSNWAKRARGRLADAAFERLVTIEAKERTMLLKSLKESRK